MGYKLNKETDLYEVYFSKRHPITRVPVTLRRRGIKTKADAKRVERELIGKVHDRLKAAIAPRWNDAVSSYLSAPRDEELMRKTLYGYEKLVGLYTKDAWGDRHIDEITTQEVRDVIKVNAGDTSLSNQRNLLKVIRGVFTHAVECGWIQRNPVPQMHFRSGVKLKAVLTKEQVRVFLEKAKELGWEWYPHCALALYTGMRNGELFALRWDRVNLDERQIKVDSSWNNKDGFKCTKSENDRLVEIAPPLIPMLKEMRLQAGDSPFVLPRLWRWEKGEQARELRRFLLGIGLPRLRFHDLRATWATLLLSQGVEPIRVMKMGGWEDLKTMDLYVRKAGVDIKGATDGLILHNPSREVAKVLNFERT